VKYLSIVIAIILLISCNNKTKKTEPESNNPVIATWRGGQITLKDYEDFALYYAFHYDYKTASESSFDKRREVLRDMIKFKLVELLADSLDLDTMKVMRDSYRRKLSGVAYKHYLFPDSVRRKAFSDQQIKDCYDLLKYEYNISHILFMDTGTVKLKLADSIYNELKKDPSSFSDFAQRFSDDPASAEKEGSLGWSLIVNYVQEFSDHILKMKENTISKPFKSRFGWHIAKLNEKRLNKTLGPYDKEESRIIKLLINQHKKKYDEAYSKFIDFIFDKYKVNINNENIIDLISKFNTAISKGRTFEEQNKFYNKFNVLSTLNHDTVYAVSFLDYIKKSNSKIDSLARNHIKDFIFSNYQKELISLITDELEYTKKPEVLKLVKEGMIIDYLEYFTDRYLGKQKELEKWNNILYRNYNLSINYFVLENTFVSIVRDDKK